MIARIWYRDHIDSRCRYHNVDAANVATGRLIAARLDNGIWIDANTWISPSAIMRVDLIEDAEPEEK